jgi:hypothetical protein
MATTDLSVRVRRIDDLPEMMNNGQDPLVSIRDHDSFLVSHRLYEAEDDENSRYVTFARQLKIEDLKGFITDYVRD